MTGGCYRRIIKKGTTTCITSGRISANTTTANSQGTQQATSAAQAAASFGLTNTIIFYDIEPYNSSQCGAGAGVTAFIDGWVSQLHSLGYKAAVYGSPNDAQADFSKASPRPDDVWITKPGANSTNAPVVTIWSPPPPSPSASILCDPFSTPKCSLWATDQRLKQFLIDHPKSYHNTALLNIDSDVEDAVIAGNSKIKAYNFTFTTFDCSTSVTQPLAINDEGLIVGYYRTSAGLDQGFIYDGTCHPISSSSGETHLYDINNAGQYVGTMALSGYLFVPGSSPKLITCNGFSTVPQAINDDGQISGYYDDSNGIEHGFLWNNGSCTTVDDGSFQTDIFGMTGFTDVLGMYQVRGGTCPASSNSTSVCYYGFLKHATKPVATFSFPTLTSNCDDLGAPPPPCYWVQKVNNNIEMVGYWNDFSTNTTHGFLRVGTHVTNIDCSSTDCPNVTSTSAYGVNDAPQIVGSWLDSNFHTHGFVATRMP